MAGRRKRVEPRKPQRVRSQNQFIDADSEQRPNVRLKVSSNVRRKQVLLAFARKVLERTRENIKTSMGGRWMKVQYGPRTGRPALEGTESHWRIQRVDKNRVSVQPLKSRMKMWRGHTGGVTIRPRNKKWLKIETQDGPIFLKKVKLPKRDPRPTAAQIRALTGR